jgi:hypothetical protein
MHGVHIPCECGTGGSLPHDLPSRSKKWHAAVVPFVVPC